MIESALKVASSIIVVNRDLINKVIDKFLQSEAGAAFRGAALVPLGSPKDSSAIFPYLSDVSDEYDLSAMALESALMKERPIILLDDIIQKGTTVEEIVAESLGETAVLAQGVERDIQLSGRAIENMKSRPLAIVTVAAAPEGLRSARDSLRLHGLQGDVHCYYDDFATVPSVKTALAGDPGGGEFVDFCRQVGGRLVEGERDSDQRVFGYGGWGLLVTGMFNPPTAALTALWHDGVVDGIPWRPLLRRRKKR
jgi:hypothetical protein